MNINFFLFVVSVSLLGTAVSSLSGFGASQWQWWMIFLPAGALFYYEFVKYDFDVTISKRK